MAALCTTVFPLSAKNRWGHIMPPPVSVHVKPFKGRLPPRAAVDEISGDSDCDSEPPESTPTLTPTLTLKDSGIDSSLILVNPCRQGHFASFHSTRGEGVGTTPRAVSPLIQLELCRKKERAACQEMNRLVYKHKVLGQPTPMRSGQKAPKMLKTRFRRKHVSQSPFISYLRSG